MKFEAVQDEGRLVTAVCFCTNFLGQTFEASCVFFPSPKEYISRRNSTEGYASCISTTLRIKHFYLSFF